MVLATCARDAKAQASLIEVGHASGGPVSVPEFLAVILIETVAAAYVVGFEESPARRLTHDFLYRFSIQTFCTDFLYRLSVQTCRLPSDYTEIRCSPCRSEPFNPFTAEAALCAKHTRWACNYVKQVSWACNYVKQVSACACEAQFTQYHEIRHACRLHRLH